MTLLTVSNQGFTVHNHMCGINFLSHLRGAPQLIPEVCAKWGMKWGAPAQFQCYQYRDLGIHGEESRKSFRNGDQGRGEGVPC